MTYHGGSKPGHNKGHACYTGGAGGRPEDYTIDIIEQIADELVEWIDSDESNFWFKDFCIKKHINPKYMSLWANKNDKFRKALDYAKLNQESRVFKGSMTNSYNSTMSKLCLSVNHGWIEKTAQEITATANHTISWLSEVSGETKNLVNDEPVDNTKET